MTTTMRTRQTQMRTPAQRETPAPGPAQTADASDLVAPAPPSTHRANGASRPTPQADDAGMATAEYAIATVAAAGFAGLLLLILRSDEVREMLLSIVRGALAF